MSAAIDGRVQRGERNRTAIVDALLLLLSAGEPQPSARAIAEEAGVSLRSVFQHFDDMEALYAELVERQLAHVWELFVPVDPALPFAARVDAVVGQRAQLWEHVAPVRRAARRAAPSSPVVQRGLQRVAAELRSRLATAFAFELSGGARKDMLAAVDAALSFDVWDQLRQEQGLGSAAAQRAVARLAGGALRGRES